VKSAKATKLNSLDAENELDGILSRTHILIVEDTPIQGKKLQFDLKKFGFSSTWALNGVEALKLLKDSKNDFDLVITDYEMPEMDGLELLRQMRSDPRLARLPVIVMTNVISNEVNMEALRLGASEFSPKPYVPPVLSLRIKNLLHLIEYERVLTDQNAELSEQLKTKNNELAKSNVVLSKKSDELLDANLQLLDLQNELIVASKAASLGVLGAGIAHEINNPLSIIKSYTDYFKEIAATGNFDSETICNIVDKIDKSVLRVVKIVKHLQELAATSDGSRERQNVSIDPLLDGLRGYFDEQARRIGVNVVYDLRVGTSQVLATEGMMQQAFLNLINNSLDAMANTSERTLTISSEIQEKHVIVTIHDTGCGIPPENLSKIFDPFFTTKAPGKGMGLGLSLVYRLIRDCGGEIRCKPSVQGATFIVKLCLAVS
jgi:C4-dicarboxylate-specific signal transduction histidine kinase